MAKKTTTAEENIQAVEEALSKTEHFIEKNQNSILITIGVIVLIILGYFGYQRFYLAPKEQTAQEQIFMAEKYFELDSLNLALNGDGINPGFLDIMDEFGGTKSANLAKYYCGIIYLNQGNYETAIDYLNSFSSSDQLIGPMALGAIGDCYAALNKNSKAVSYYLDAADKHANDFTSPVFLMKAGWAYEVSDDYQQAVKVYQRIKEEFPKSQEAREMDKYIARAQGLSKK